MSETQEAATAGTCSCLAFREVEVLSEPKEVTTVHTLIPVLPLATNAWAATGQWSWPHRPEEHHGHKHVSKGALEWGAHGAGLS